MLKVEHSPTNELELPPRLLIDIELDF